jgi:hypothetical protein
MTLQKNSTRVSNAFGDFATDILKALIVNIIIGILGKYAKKWIIPFLIRSRFRITLVLHIFAVKLHIESFDTFLVAFFTLAYKSATKEQKATIRQTVSNALSHYSLSADEK